MAKHQQFATKLYGMHLPRNSAHKGLKHSVTVLTCTKIGNAMRAATATTQTSNTEFIIRVNFNRNLLRFDAVDARHTNVRTSSFRFPAPTKRLQVCVYGIASPCFRFMSPLSTATCCRPAQPRRAELTRLRARVRCPQRSWRCMRVVRAAPSIGRSAADGRDCWMSFNGSRSDPRVSDRFNFTVTPRYYRMSDDVWLSSFIATLYENPAASSPRVRAPDPLAYISQQPSANCVNRTASAAS